MNESETLQAISDIMREALKNPTMSSEVSQERILSVISYSAQLYSTDKKGQNSHSLQKVINNVILPYVKARDKDSTDVFNLCKIVLENWDKEE